MQTIDTTNHMMVVKDDDKGYCIIDLEKLVMGDPFTIIGHYFSNDEPSQPQTILRKSHYGQLMLKQCLKAFGPPVDYSPTFPAGYYYWVVNDDGYAKFSQCKPEMGKSIWFSSGNALQDNNFNPVKYKHMWENEAWKKSMIEIPNFD